MKNITYICVLSLAWWIFQILLSLIILIKNSLQYFVREFMLIPYFYTLCRCAVVFGVVVVVVTRRVGYSRITKKESYIRVYWPEPRPGEFVLCVVFINRACSWQCLDRMDRVLFGRSHSNFTTYTLNSLDIRSYIFILDWLEGLNAFWW